ncbi:hypothetical protein GOODEAATRI_034663 [Goodea atripinnis]|uniref:Uncharacterized protein n=1 Tax=Goodea atripinnis TaxID=208336 RepID=A0ABV0N6K4_9TELE
MGQEKVVDSFIVPELEIAGLDSDMYYDMPNLFTQHKMPVDLSNIPKQQDLDIWHGYLATLEVRSFARDQGAGGAFDWHEHAQSSRTFGGQQE